METDPITGKPLAYKTEEEIAHSKAIEKQIEQNLIEQGMALEGDLQHPLGAATVSMIINEGSRRIDEFCKKDETMQVLLRLLSIWGKKIKLGRFYMDKIVKEQIS